MEELTAYHEAGHAFVAVFVGACVQSVSIEPDDDDGPDRYGDTVVEWDHGRFTKRQLVEKSILVALAGPMAEAIHRGEVYHPGVVPEWAADWRIAWNTAEGLRLSDRARLDFLEQAAMQAYRLMNRDDMWAAVAGIVDHLLAHERLEGNEVHDIVSHWIA